MGGRRGRSRGARRAAGSGASRRERLPPRGERARRARAFRAPLTARAGPRPLLVGQSLELWRPPLAGALRRRDPAPLQARAARQIAAGAHALDLNLGAGSGAASASAASLAADLAWAAAATREAAPDVALWLDCADVAALALAVAAVPPPVVANAAPLDGSTRARDLLAAAAASGAGVVLSPAPLEAAGAAAAPPSLDALLAAAAEARGLLAAAGLAEAWFDCLAYPAATDAPRARRSLALVRALAADEARLRLRPLLAVGNVAHGTASPLRPGVRRVYARAAAAAGAEALILPVEQPALIDAVAAATRAAGPVSPDSGGTA